MSGGFPVGGRPQTVAAPHRCRPQTVAAPYRSRPQTAARPYPGCRAVASRPQRSRRARDALELQRFLRDCCLAAPASRKISEVMGGLRRAGRRARVAPEFQRSLQGCCLSASHLLEEHGSGGKLEVKESPRNGRGARASKTRIRNSRLCQEGPVRSAKMNPRCKCRSPLEKHRSLSLRQQARCSWRRKSHASKPEQALRAAAFCRSLGNAPRTGRARPSQRKAR